MMMKTTSATLLLLSASTVEAAEQLRASSSSAQRSRSLFFCFLGGCDDTNSEYNPSLFGEFCMPLFGPCQPRSDDLDYSQCANNTEGLFGGRPLLGDCGVLTEVLDGFVGSTDTDGDGLNDEAEFRNPFEGRVNEDGSVNTTGVPASWLQIFPVDSLVWDIFGPDEFKFNVSIFDGAIDAIFGEGSTFGKLVVVPFALDWEPTFGNTTCPLANDPSTSVMGATPTPKCMTPLGRDGYYVCRTLYNPYTAKPDPKTICADLEEELLVPNDACGCCGGVCPETIAEKECPCRCDVTGVNDGFSIAGGLGERCVSKEYGVATMGQFDVDCSTACLAA